MVGEFCYHCMHSVKAGLEGCPVAPGDVHRPGPEVRRPIDGHDEHAVESALRSARDFNAPVIVHVVTRKGMGYGPAGGRRGRADARLRRHRPGTGLASEAALGWTTVFSTS